LTKLVFQNFKTQETLDSKSSKENAKPKENIPGVDKIVTIALSATILGRCKHENSRNYYKIILIA
jgi:hypothetical protein